MENDYYDDTENGSGIKKTDVKIDNKEELTYGEVLEARKKQEEIEEELDNYDTDGRNQ